MANLNKIVRRRQLALLIALVIGTTVGGVGTWMLSEMNLKKSAPPKAQKGEPAPDMTGVVNQSFDSKVQRSAIAEAQRLNKETQSELKKMRNEMGALSRDLKSSQSRINELEEENKLLQTQLDVGKNFDNLNSEPLPGALISKGDVGRSSGSVPPPTNFWPLDSGVPQTPAAPVMTALPRAGQLDVEEFLLPERDLKTSRYPWIHSGSFADAIVVEGADANASVTGDKNTVPMQLRLTGKVQMPNDGEFDLTGCFVTLEAWGDVSSERAIVRTRSISCQLGEDTIDQKIAGHVSFMGKNGIKGEVVMRNGQILLYAGGSGFLDGIGKGIEKASSTTVGVGATASMSAGEIAQAGFGGGVSSAAKTLSDYYIKRAEQYHPVIPIGAGNEVTLVFQDGFQLETLQEAREKKAVKQKAQRSTSATTPPTMPTNTPDMLKQLGDFKVGDVVAFDSATGEQSGSSQS
ncbi:F-type conjugal transfer pilus assembly protein TraB [Yersinia enterocolitica]|uniref:F-type conjugal transfer pilus assembly protein TraB n=1 Tax=Yersinia enterocolitica TaxID=630 RepID=UPI0029A720B3|nr:F-type conjugal transfer pilus assembly protein TraB [Yersinia enterocolitica]HEI6777243.1 F-type conjugal transfer pilus assembly protein TraB [Yersinia enterocolitica]HEI6781501.1 F-type conjugal transfer pilus assembly protein TraB [Yersinia enterocolitica]HEI6785784.1 F-type conjugal transfer pilus assembly protein TraB [Yersinia enterocolitica]HEI6840771.1 F-type conjugal transfer pilus assembly protein TraB [Yersinia enterocolitica]